MSPTWKTTTANEAIEINVGGHTGAYTVNWGYSTVNTTQTGNAVHAYATPGSYNVSISGDFQRFIAGNSTNAGKLTALVQWGNTSWSSMADSFRNARYMTYNATHAPDLSRVADTTFMFYDARAFTGDLSSWDTSSVTNMTSMFDGASAFNGDVSSWNVSQVTDMKAMFYLARAFNDDVSSWNTSSVTDMNAMFTRASAFNQDVSSWDTSGVTDMSYMFHSASAFNQSLSSWNTSSVTDMSYMFHSASAFNGDVSVWNVSQVTDMSGMFRSTPFNRNLSSWDTSRVTTMNAMFASASAFNQNLSSWDTSSVTDMFGMFHIAGSFNGDVSTWNTSAVTDMRSMFSSASAFNQDISSWDVSAATAMSNMFTHATAFSQNLGPWYITLDNTALNLDDRTVGGVAAQNSVLDGHVTGYSLAGGTDDSLFTLHANKTLSIKNEPAKTSYSIRVQATGSLYGQSPASAVLQLTADIARPTVSSAAYQNSTGVLTITFSEPLDSSKHVPSKFHVRNITQSAGGVTMSNGTITNNGTSSLAFTLAVNDRNSVGQMATPRLYIDAGAVSDIAGNTIDAAANKTIAIRDTTKPTFASATYTTGSGVLNITFSEPLDSSKHVAIKFHVRGSGQSMGGVTMSNGTISANGTDSLTFTLSNSDTGAVKQLTAPIQLDIDAGAVSDIAGNAIDSAVDQTITILDGTKPTFASAVYKTGSGALNITFSEPLDSSKHVASKFHIRNITQSAGGITLSNGTIAANGTSFLTFNLSSADRNSMGVTAVPRLYIDAGAVSDTAGNTVDAAANQTVTIQDTAKPAFVSATYDAATGALNMTFSEPLDSSKHVASKFHVRTAGLSAGGITLSNGTIATNGTSFLAFNLGAADRLSVNAIVSPQLDIDAGAVSDTAGNAIDAAADRTIAVTPLQPGPDHFTTTWNTTAANEAIEINAGSHTGTYTVIWGDGASTVQSGNAAHAYANPGSYNVSVSGDFQRFTAGNSTNAAKLAALVQWGNMSWSSTANSFKGAANMEYEAADAPDLSRVADMSGMFDGAAAFDGDISGWDVSSATAMTRMFKNAAAFDGNLSAWNVSSVTDTAYMFHGAAAFDGDISGWDTSAVTDANHMFYNAAAFDGDISGWDVSSVTDMDGMFNGAAAFDGDISGWDVSSVTDMDGMFNGAAAFDGDISGWDVSSVTDMDGMFNGAAAFNGDISGWDISSVTFMVSMFDGAAAFNQNLGPWYITLDDAALNLDNRTVGAVATQNSALGLLHDPAYSLVNGTGDADNSLFTLHASNKTLSINDLPNKTSYSVRVGASGASLFGANNSLAVQITADLVRPNVSSAAYQNATGVLTVVFSEALDPSKHVPSKFHVRESGNNAGGVTMSNGTITANGTNYLAFTLNSTAKAIVDAMASPRIHVDAGAVSDAYGNAIVAALNQTVTTADTIRPTFVSAVYLTGSGQLTITFSEPLDASKHVPSKFHIREFNQNAGGITIPNGTITANGTDSLTFTLDANDRDAVSGMAVPELHIDAGAVSDAAGNPAAAAAKQAITVRDTTKPAFTSATYDTGSGRLTVLFSETLDSSKHVAAGFEIRDAGLSFKKVAMSDGSIITNGTSFLIFQLDTAQKNSVNAMASPRLYIAAGAVTDAAGNPNADALNRTMTVYDTIRPEFTSAAHLTGSGELTVTFSERLDASRHAPSKFHVREFNQNAGGVTMSAGTITANGTDYLTFTLGTADKIEVNAMNPPLLRMDAGAVSDTAGNPVDAAADLPVTVLDTAKPAFVSAEYATGSGRLAVTFSEALDSSRHVASKFHVRESGQNAGGVTLSNGTITANGTDSVTFALGAADKAAVNSMASPRLHVDEGAVSDTAGNPVDAAADLPVTVLDTAKPAFVSAEYATGSGRLAVTFSEALDSSRHVASKFHVRESGQNAGGVTLSNGTITNNGTDSVTFALGAADKAAVNSMASPRLHVDEGAVSDTAGNPVDAAADLTISVTRPAPAPAPAPSAGGSFAAVQPAPEAPVISMIYDKAPEPLEARYDAATRAVFITFDEPVSVADPDGFALASAGGSLNLHNFSGGASRVVAASAPDGDIAPRDITLAIRAGAVVDGGGAGNPAYGLPASAYDSAAPSMRSAAYYTSLGVLVVTFDQHVNGTKPELFGLGNYTLAGASETGTAPAASVYFSLNASGRDAILQRPYISLAEGAVTGPDGKASAPTSNAPVQLRHPLDAGSIRSAAYDVASGTLWLEVAGGRVSLNPSAVALDGVPLSDVKVRLNGDLVSEGNATLQPAAGMSLNISRGAIATAYGVLPHIPRHPVDVFDGITGVMISETPGNATATRVLHGAADAVRVASTVPGGIRIWDVLSPNATEYHVAVDGAVLDVEPVEVSGWKYVAVLTNATLSLLDLDDPAGPPGTIRHDAAIPHGTVSPVMLDGVEHMVLITPDEARLILVSEPDSPRLISAAALRESPGESLDSVTASSGGIITALKPGGICALVVSDASEFAADCRDRAGDAGAVAYGAAYGVQRVAVAGEGASVYDGALKLRTHIQTGSPPADVGIMFVYGAPYLAVIDSGVMRIYDISGGEPAAAAALDGSFVSLDVVQLGGSAYVVLTDSEGAVSLVDTARGPSPGGTR